MCIWKVAEEDRMCEFCTYRGGCETHRSHGLLAWDLRARRYVETMSRICGMDIVSRVKKNRAVWARNIVAYWMRKCGYTLGQAADAICRDHATVVHAQKQVECMLAYPNVYKEEYDIWCKFMEEIGLPKDSDYVEENSEMVVLPGSEPGGAQG